MEAGTMTNGLRLVLSASELAAKSWGISHAPVAIVEERPMSGAEEVSEAMNVGRTVAWLAKLDAVPKKTKSARRQKKLRRSIALIAPSA
jgi:hypothetical protein